MLAFLLAAIALLALALAFVLPTLWAPARRSALAMLVALPLAAGALYVAVGTPDALDAANRDVPTSIEQAVAQLERRLEREPDSLEGWVLLGRTRKNQGRETAAAGDFAVAMPHFAASAEAFRKARAIAPHEPDLLVETAEAISLSNAERAFGAEGTALLDEALTKVPNHQRALWFRGIAAVQAGDAVGAVQRWEALLPMVDVATAEALREQIAGAREAAGMPPMDPALAAMPAGEAVDAASDPNAAVSASADPVPGAPGTLTVTINADAEALAALPPQAVLFVFARNADAPGPPVAAKRLQGSRLPLTLTLSDADRLMPTATLSATPRVEVSARYARSGSVQPEAGDLVAAPVVVELGKAGPLTLQLVASDAPTDAARAPTFGP